MKKESQNHGGENHGTDQFDWSPGGEHENHGSREERVKRARGLMNTAQGYVKLALWYDAKREVEKVSEEDLGDREDLGLFAWLTLETGQHLRAHAISLCIIAEWPDDYYAWSIASYALYHLKRFTEARRFIVEGPDEWKQKAMAWYQLGCIDAALRNFTSARRCVTTAIELRPDLVEMAFEDEDMRHIRKFIGELRSATMRDKSFVTNMEQTRRFLEAKLPEDARARLETVGDSNQKTALYLLRRCGVYIEDNQWQKALPFCILLCRRMPFDHTPYCNTALCLQSLGRFAESGYFLLAAPDDKFQEKVYHHLAATYFLKQGKIKRAKHSLEQLVRLSPSYGEKARKDKMLKPLWGFLDWLIKTP